MGDFVHFIEFLYKFSIPLYHLYKAPFAFSRFLPSPFTLIVYQAFTVKPPPVLPSFCLQAPSSADNSVIVYILIYPLVHIPFSIEAYL